MIMTKVRNIQQNSNRDAYLARTILLQPDGDINLIIKNTETAYEDSHNKLTDVLSAFGNPLSSTLTLGQNMVYGEPNLFVDMPPVDQRLAQREQTVEDLYCHLESKTMLYLHGSKGCGKTQLALLLAKRANINTIWLRLLHYDFMGACYIIETALSKLSETKPEMSRQGWLKKVFTKIQKPLLIVLDDLPETNASSHLAELIVMLSHIAAEYQCKVICTSNHILPARVRGLLNKEAIFMMPPGFTDQEIGDLFRVYGAPDGFVNSIFHLIIASSQRHPLFLNALVSYFEKNEWKTDWPLINNVMTKSYARDIRDEMQAIITSMDRFDRELLYRLSIFDIPFNEEDVEQIAEIMPQIEFRGERLARLVGVWIQPENNQRHIVSPVIMDIGEKNLDKATLRDVHSIVAQAILANEHGSVFDGMRTIVHLTKAEEFEKMASLLYQMLDGFVKSKDVHKDDWGITSLWHRLPLPDKISIEARLAIRIIQIEACRKVGKDFSAHKTDVGEILNSIDLTNGFACAAAIAVSLKLLRIDFELATHAFLIACKGSVQIEKHLPTKLTYSWETILWVFINEINTPKKLELWIECFAQLSEEQLKNAEKAEFSEYGYRFAADKIWLAEEKKSDRKQNWDAVLKALRKLEDCAWNRERYLLWAYAIRAQCIVLAEYKKQLKSAIELAETGFNKKQDSITQYLLSEIIAREYAYAKINDKAMEWFSSMISIPVEGMVNDRIDGLLHACETFGQVRHQEAARFSEMAVKLVNENRKNLSSNRVVKVLGEHAIALWHAQGPTAAFETYEIAASELIASRKDTAEWKSLFLVFGHVSGYFSSVASTGTPPISDQGEYFIPRNGLFIRYSSDVFTLYDENKACLFWSMVCMYAEAVDRLDVVRKWASQGYSWSSDHNGIMLTMALPVLIEENRIQEAIELSFNLAALFTNYSKDKLFTLNTDQLRRELGSKPSERWNVVESFVAYFAIIPIYLELAYHKLVETNEFAIRAGV